MTWGAGAWCPELLGNPTWEAFLCTTDLEQAVVEKPLADLRERGTASELTAQGCTAEPQGSMLGVDCALCHQKRKCCPHSSNTHCIPGLQNHHGMQPCLVCVAPGYVAQWQITCSRFVLSRKGKKSTPCTQGAHIPGAARAQSTATRVDTAGAAEKAKPLVSVGSSLGVEKGSRFPQLLLSEFDCF